MIKIAEEMNNFFKNAVLSLDINKNSYITSHNIPYTNDPIEKAIEKYKFHLNILFIKKETKCEANSFDFAPVTLNDVEKEIKKLNPIKATTFNIIPFKMLIKTSNISAQFVHKILNESVETRIYPDNIKLADITPVFKKKDPLNKINYRPVSVLPSVSKIFQKLLQHQFVNYIENYLSVSPQQPLISLIENCKKSLDQKGYGGAVLMDLSKTFDIIKHDLLLAKFHAYDFSKKALKIIHNYLRNRWHKTKINKDFSTWQELLHGAPQRCVLGPLLFNMCLNDLLFVIESIELCNFAHDTTNRLKHNSFLGIE